jgi:membrane protein DedA with SNARE-associated domain
MPLADLISLQTLQQALRILGYPAVTLFLLVECAGVPFPGETILLLASFYAGIGHELQIPVIIVCAAFGAIMGDNLGYYIGRTGGQAWLKRCGRYLFLKPRHFDRAEQFFAKHGSKTVFIGRFTAILRTWSAFLAGVNRMPWRTFLIYNAAGGVLWTMTFGAVGYFAGLVFHENFTQVEHIASTIGSIVAGIIVMGCLGTLIFFRLHRTHHKYLTTQATDMDTSQA